MTLKFPEIKRFRSITGKDVHTDLHIHSTWTDGAQSVADIAEFAKRLCLNPVAVTDHVRKNSTYCPEYEREIKNISSEYGLRIIAGFEAKVINADGDLDLPGFCSPEKHLIIGSVHSVNIEGRTVHPKDIPSDEFPELELKYSLSIIKGGKAHVLGHAGGMSIANHGGFSLGCFERIIAACSKTDVAFEVNSRYHGKYISDLWPMLEKYNPLVCFGSDAHETGEIGNCVKMVEKLIWTK